MIKTNRRQMLGTAGAAALAAACFSSAKLAQAKTAPFGAKIVTVGNSLIDQSVDMVDFFRKTQRRDAPTISQQTIPGAPMAWNWNHAHDAYLNGKELLRKGGQDVWMGVESVPFRYLQNPGDPCDVDAWVNWYNAAVNGGVQHFVVFEAWHDLETGSAAYQQRDSLDPDGHIPWRERIDFSLQYWRGIAEHVNNKKRPGDPSARLAPGGQMLAAIYDDIASGAAPASIQSIRDIFSDTIHPNIRGRYAMACVMYASIFGASPFGMPARTKNRHGVPYERIPIDEAAYFQKLAWKVVQSA